MLPAWKKTKKKTKKEDLPFTYRVVLSLIPVGKIKTITVKEIVSVTGYKDQDVRNIVSELVKKHGYPVGGSNEKGRQGYARCTTEMQREAAIRNLSGRIKQMQERIEALRVCELDTELEWFDEEIEREWKKRRTEQLGMWE